MDQAKTSKISLVSAAALLLSCGSAAAADIDTNTARMQAMDKITGKVSEIDVPVNGEAQFGSFSIVVRRCVTRSPEETPENTAFVDVVDNYKSDEPINIFKGWMLSSSPALNAVEHPIYDVWLLKCYDSDTKDKKLLSADELALRDEIPMQKSFEESVNKISPENGAHDTVSNTMAEDTSESKTAVSESEKAPTNDERPTETIAVVVSDVEESEDGSPKSLLRVYSGSSAKDTATDTDMQSDGSISADSENTADSESAADISEHTEISGEYPINDEADVSVPVDDAVAEENAMIEDEDEDAFQ